MPPPHSLSHFYPLPGLVATPHHSHFILNPGYSAFPFMVVTSFHGTTAMALRPASPSE